jgi:pyruvate/2-oxoglutarate dehydrogenase complex dihydrolipoamide acyltransferase (E2) component
MRRPILAPDAGAPAPLVSLWYVHLGEHVYTGDRIVELLLGSATFDVAAPCTGRLADRAAWPGDLAAPGMVLGYIEEDADS